MTRSEPPLELELEVHPDALLDHERLLREALARAGARAHGFTRVQVLRRAIDARRGRVRLRLKVALWRVRPETVAVQPLALPTLTGAPRVAIVGAGPAGLFCALGLARAGIRPIVLERGKPVQPRRRDIARLSQRGELDPDSNYCFGEGGAGTFSDGKLYTRADKRGPVRLVLETLVGYGADPEILIDARPHVGTNRLPALVTAMREHLIAAGTEFRFEARAEALLVHDGRVVGVALAGGEVVDVPTVVLAPGHSARDVLAWLRLAGVAMVGKPCAMGVRIEHPQGFVDRLQFGELAGHPALGPASYRVVERVGDVGVFSFCMCPGGHVAPAATEPGGQVVNGWSPSRRHGRFANAGFVVEVGPAQLAVFGQDPDDPFAGLAVQLELEHRAYEQGGGDFVAPGQRLVDLLAGRDSADLPAVSYPRGARPARLDRVLGPLAPALGEALRRVGAKMHGYVEHEAAVALGVETRTSSPVRIERDRDTLCSPSHPGLYPCGEGAGYAGGIVSAALDGLRVAEAVTRTLDGAVR